MAPGVHQRAAVAAWDKLVLEQLLHSVLSVDSNAPLLSKEVVTYALRKDQNTAMQDLESTCSFLYSKGFSKVCDFLWEAFKYVTVVFWGFCLPEFSPQCVISTFSFGEQRETSNGLAGRMLL